MPDPTPDQTHDWVDLHGEFCQSCHRVGADCICEPEPEPEDDDDEE